MLHSRRGAWLWLALSSWMWFVDDEQRQSGRCGSQHGLTIHLSWVGKVGGIEGGRGWRLLLVSYALPLFSRPKAKSSHDHHCSGENPTIKLKQNCFLVTDSPNIVTLCLPANLPASLSVLMTVSYCPLWLTDCISHFLSVCPSQQACSRPLLFELLNHLFNNRDILQSVTFICRLAAAANGAINHQPAFDLGGWIFFCF